MKTTQMTTTAAATPFVLLPNVIPALRKRCDCAQARWPKCKHSFVIHNNVPGGRLGDLSLNKYMKRTARPEAALIPWRTVEHRTRAAADKVGALMLAEHYAGTLETTMAGNAWRLPVAAPAAVADTTPQPVIAQSFSEAAALFHARHAPADGHAPTADTWSKDEAKSQKLRFGVLGRTTPSPARGIFGDWPVTAITSADIEIAFRQATADCTPGERGNSSRNKYRRALTSVFDEAVRRGWIAASPITKWTAIKGGQCFKRDQNVDIERESRLIAAAFKLGESDDPNERTAGKRLAFLILAAVECGARVGELLAVQIEDIDLTRNLILLTADEPGSMKNRKRGSLTGTPRIVPISSRLRPHLIDAMKDPSGQPLTAKHYVFGNGFGQRVQRASLTRLWHEVVLLAHQDTTGVAIAYRTGDEKRRQSLTPECWAALATLNLHFHDIRHEAAIRWHHNKVDLRAIAALLGHRDLTQLQVYLNCKQDDALSIWRSQMGEATAAEAAAPTVPVEVKPFLRLVKSA